MSQFIKLYIDQYSLFNAEFAFYYDGEFNKLHVLDLDNPGRRTVTNAACADLFDNIDAQLFLNYNEAASWHHYDIYLYGTDGLVAEFDPETNQFKHVPAFDEHLYEPFKKICNERFFDFNIK